MFRSSSCCSPLIGLSILLVTLLLSWVSPAIQQIIGEGEMNENRSSNTLCCAWNIRTGWNPDIGDRLLAMVRGANTRLWTNGLRGAGSRVDFRCLESNAGRCLWSTVDGDFPTSGYAR